VKKRKKETLKCHVYVRYKTELPWLSFVKHTLDELGFSNNWLSQSVPSPFIFKSLVKSSLRDQFIQSWNSDVQY
jgi:hypothetical protein